MPEGVTLSTQEALCEVAARHSVQGPPPSSVSGTPTNAQSASATLILPMRMKIAVDSIEYKCWHEVGHATVRALCYSTLFLAQSFAAVLDENVLISS